MIFREAKKHDVEQIFKIEIQNFGECEATPIEVFAEIVTDTQKYQNYLLMCLEYEKIVGFYCTIDEGDIVRLVDIAVDASEHRKGYGKLLLQNCIEKYQDRIVRLKVREDNVAAINLYKSFGFQTKEILKDYYQNCDGLLMEKLRS